MNQPDDKPTKGPRISKVVLKSAIDGGTISDSAKVQLKRFLDTSSVEAEQASASALTAITHWVDQTDADTVNHVADGNITASKVSVPTGPFTDEQAKDIVRTVKRVRQQAGTHAWERKKTYGGWITSLVVALIALTAVLIRFF